MKNIKYFDEFIKESYLQDPANPNLLKHDKKKMEKNGYIEAVVIKSFDNLKKNDKVLVSATEFGELEDDSLVTCYKDNKEIIIPKENLEIKI